MSKLTFDEAERQANKGDILRLTIEASDNKPGFQTDIVKGDHNESGEFTLSWDHYHRKLWQIIPAKKEMVDFDEIWKESTHENHLQVGRDWFDLRWHSKKFWQASAKNTHLLYADLMNLTNEYCKEYHRSEIVAKLRPAIDKINAVLTTSSTG